MKWYENHKSVFFSDEDDDGHVVNECFKYFIIISLTVTSLVVCFGFII